jgi:hypothetical protein
MAILLGAIKVNVEIVEAKIGDIRFWLAPVYYAAVCKKACMSVNREPSIN